MEISNFIEFTHLSHDPQKATLYVADVLLRKIHPITFRIRNKLQANFNNSCLNDITKVKDVFSLCCNQIKKCIFILFDIFKLENHRKILLQESRLCTLDRLLWCFNRLIAIENHLGRDDTHLYTDNSNDLIFVTPMYFINWIDHCFEVLTKLSDIAYRTDYKDNQCMYKQWIKELVDCVHELHISLDELLLSAMTLCKYYLPCEQHIVKTRCQVVLRETKALLTEVIKGDLTAPLNVTPDLIKLPIKPSNVNLLIDVLKDVLYALETNTNTALLSLLVYCFSSNKSPIDVLLEHFNSNNNCGCVCAMKNENSIKDDCSYVNEFDLYNERLLQIGSFAASCSSDQNRNLLLRSGLASLEALDPHLVPALMLSMDSYHAKMLINIWRQEVNEIKECVFLIVDPAAFTEKIQQIMHQKLLGIIKQNHYNNGDVCSLINVGGIMYEFLNIYDKHEPDALDCHEQLLPLINDLNKVLLECKIVSNLLSSGEDFLYEVTVTMNSKEPSMDQLLKRLKLLYTIINRINSLLHPKDNDVNLFNSECHDATEINNLTRTLYNGGATYVNSPKATKNNVSIRSVFARTNVKSSPSNFPLRKLTNHLKLNNEPQLNFSEQLDELFNLSDVKNEGGTVVKEMRRIRESFVLYDLSLKKRSSLRKAVLNRHFKVGEMGREDTLDGNVELESLMDDITSLQITDILDQMQDVTTLFSKSQLSKSTKTVVSVNTVNNNIEAVSKDSNNALRLNINNGNATISKYQWNIPKKSSAIETPLDDSNITNNNESNITQPSNVSTLERINDLDLVESKINSLRHLHKETSL